MRKSRTSQMKPKYRRSSPFSRPTHNENGTTDNDTKIVKYPRRCTVPYCNTTKNKEISLHYFPKDPKLRETWQSSCQINFPVSRHMQVCNRHFAPEDFYPGIPPKKRYLKKNAVPSQNLPDPDCVVSYQSNQYEITEIPHYTYEEEETNEEEEVEVIYETSDEMPDEEMFGSPVSEVVFYDTQEETDEQLTCQEGEAQYVNDEEVELQTVCPGDPLSRMLDTDDKLIAFTGINAEVLETICKCALNTMKLNDYTWTNITKRVILVLCKLRLNLPFDCLAVLFQTSKTECKDIFCSTVSVLSLALKPAVYWPSKREALAKMPKSFSNFLNTRVILHCLEIDVQDLECNQCNLRTYSKERQKNTLKYLLGSTPSGRVSFLSFGFGGGVSDKDIFLYADILEKVDPYDAIMVNSDFQIEQECCAKGVTLIVFPNFGGINEKLKSFKILQEQFDCCLTSYADEIMNIVASVVNLSSSAWCNTED